MANHKQIQIVTEAKNNEHMQHADLMRSLLFCMFLPLTYFIIDSPQSDNIGKAVVTNITLFYRTRKKKKKTMKKHWKLWFISAIITCINYNWFRVLHVKFISYTNQIIQVSLSKEEWEINNVYHVSKIQIGNIYYNLLFYNYGKNYCI